jgi:hypothetical protein
MDTITTMPPEYPAAFKTWTPLQDLIDDAKAQQMNEAYDEITAIQTALGINPQGDADDVTARLTAIESLFPPTPAAHKTSHQLSGNDEINAASLSGRINYVDRGDLNGLDWYWNEFIADALWHDLDCSDVVPQGAQAIHFLLHLRGSVAGTTFRLRKKGYLYTYSCPGLWCQVTQVVQELTVIVPCDTNRFVQYYINSNYWNSGYVNILGWFI